MSEKHIRMDYATKAQTHKFQHLKWVIVIKTIPKKNLDNTSGIQLILLQVQILVNIRNLSVSRIQEDTLKSSIH